MLREPYIVVSYTRRDPEVSQAVSQLAEITGWPRWYAKNIVLWRKARRLPVFVERVL